ncbi:MAG TPA: hypothetical protein VF805_00135, partial [Anaeromyxobacteraceae bacterium]
GERVRALETALAEAQEGRARAERDAAGRVSAAEVRVAEASRLRAQLQQERKDADARALRALAEAQARFQEELSRRDEMRGQEAQRLQAAVQERSRQLRVAELEIQRLRAGNVARGAPSPTPAPLPESAANESEGK